MLALVVATSLLVAPHAGSLGPSITGTQIVATAGQPFTQSIGTATGIVGEVSVDWADGSPAESVTIQPDGSLPATHTYAQEGDYDVTMSASGQTGHTTVFVLTPSQGGALTGSDTEAVPPGGTGGASTTVGSTAITGTLTHSGAAPGSAVLFVGIYTDNPQPTPLAAFAYYDVRVTGSTTEDVLVVVFQYPATAAGPPQLLFFDAATSSYRPVVGSPLVVDTTQHTITITFGASSTPSITSLTGTVFAVALSREPSFTG